MFLLFACSIRTICERTVSVYLWKFKILGLIIVLNYSIEFRSGFFSRAVVSHMPSLYNCRAEKTKRPCFGLLFRNSCHSRRGVEAFVSGPSDRAFTHSSHAWQGCRWLSLLRVAWEVSWWRIEFLVCYICQYQFFVERIVEELVLQPGTGTKATDTAPLSSVEFQHSVLMWWGWRW